MSLLLKGSRTLPSIPGGTLAGVYLLVSDTALGTEDTKQDKQDPCFHGIYVPVGTSNKQGNEFHFYDML